MRHHEWEFLQLEEPETHSIRLFMLCRECNCSVNSVVTHQTIAFSKADVVNLIFKKLKLAVNKIPEDCDETKLLNICKSIHES